MSHSKALPLRRISGEKTVDFLLGAALGILFFVALYGISTLQVTYDSWIYKGYIEEDIIQRYAGWLYFRNDAWRWPLTVAENFSQPLGASIVYTDSFPLWAVVCKLFAPLLPATFQYIGWSNLVSCALQGGFAMLLVRHFKIGRALSAVSSIFFITAPIFVERLFRHDPLASHWLILAALLLYFRARENARFPFWGFWALCCLAPTVTTYFVPMVYALLAAALLEYAFRSKTVLRPALWLGACFAGTLVVAYAFGILTRGGGGSAAGFGQYSLNLNALVNPTSFDWYAESGAFAWSAFLPVLPQYHHQYDGFNYLGAGILLGLCAMVVYGAAKAILALVRKDGSVFKKARRFLAGHLWLLLVCLCLTVFAVSNVVTLGEATLFTASLPAPVLALCGIFRASARMFWPCWYLLVLSVVVWCARAFKRHWKFVAILLLLAVQLADISPALYKKHEYFAQGALRQQNEFTTDLWVYMATNYDTVLCLGNLFDYNLASGLIRYNPKVQTNLIFTNRGTFAVIEAGYGEMQEMLKSGAPLPDGVLYLCSDEATYNEIMTGLNENARGYRFGHYFGFANPIEGMPAEGDLPEKVLQQAG